MASVSNKLFEIFRYLKSDAVPKAPRQKTAEQTDAEPQEPRGSRVQPDVDDTPYNINEAGDESDHEEIIFNEDDYVKDEDFVKNDFAKGEKKPKFNFPFQKKKGKDDPKDPKKSKGDKKGSFSSVNTQATGPVFNIVNASGVQVGSNHVYYMSATGSSTKSGKSTSSDHVQVDNLITLLMESTIQPTHKYIYFVANNLGAEWQAFYVSLGFLKGRVETMKEEHGITEARYKLLREWVDNKDGTLGRLATLLWEEGERQIVRELSLIYKENKK